jgi:hypothetical protein
MLSKDEAANAAKTVYYAIWNPNPEYKIAILTEIEITTIFKDYAIAKTKKVIVLAGTGEANYEENAAHPYKYMFKTLAEAQYNLIDQIFKMQRPNFD